MVIPMQSRFSYFLPWLAVALLLAACATPETTPRAADTDPAPAREQPDSASPPPQTKPEPDPANVRVTTEPSGSSLRIGDHQPQQGQSIELTPGVYDLIVKNDGYLSHREQIILEPGENVVRHVELLPENADLTINLTPSDAAVEVNGSQADVVRPIKLSPGQYEIAAKHPGYFPWETTLDLRPGENRVINLTMEALPTSGSITLEAHHTEAAIVVDDVEVGTGRVTLEALAFGEHRAESIRQLADWRRERAGQDFQFDQGWQNALGIHGASLEYLYQGSWLPAEDALNREARDYRESRTENPVYLRASLDETTTEKLAAREDLGGWLHGLMRPGDRIALDARGGAKVLLWARQETPGHAFAEAVAAFKAGTDYQPPWQEQHGPEPRAVTLAQPVDLPFALLADRPHSPMMAFEGPSLRGLTPETQLLRAASDGRVRLLIEGGDGLQLDDAELKAGPFGLIDHILDPADAEHTIQWSEVPERLLIMPETGNRVTGPAAVELLRGEKQLVTVSLGTQPIRVHQLTQRLSEPAFSRWQTLGSQLGAGRAVDLRKVELGPHDREGQYRRTWVFEFTHGSGATQRQVSADYFIGNEAIETESGLFLRRLRRQQLDQDG